MELTDILFQSNYYKFYHGMFVGLSGQWYKVKRNFELLFSERQLNEYCNFKYDTENRFYFISSDITNCQQLVYIYLFADYLDCYQFIKFPFDIIKKAHKKRLSGEMTFSQLKHEIGLESWTIAICDTLKESINQVKELNKLS